jgi:hypothetical protein
MCDYSLHGVLTRPAVVAETLASTKFVRGPEGGGLLAIKVYLPKERAVPKRVLEL